MVGHYKIDILSCDYKAQIHIVYTVVLLIRVSGADSQYPT